MVVAEAEQAVKQMNRLSDTLRHVAGGGSTVLPLGYVGTLGPESLIVSTIRTFRSSFPDVLIETEELSVRDPFCLLQNSELYTGIIRRPMPVNRLITHRIIQQLSLKQVAADNHALHLIAEIRMQHLQNETLIILNDPEGAFKSEEFSQSVSDVYTGVHKIKSIYKKHAKNPLITKHMAT